MRSLHHMVLLSVAWGLAAAGLSCKEQLPAYRDPRDVFSGEISALYSVSQTENDLKAYVTVLNSYDETFDGRGVLTGRLVLTWAADQSFRKTVDLSPDRLIRINGYDPATGNYVFDSGDSLRFGFSWSMTSDDGRSLFDLLPFVPDPSCPRRLISRDPVHIQISAEATIYSRTEVVVPRELTYIFILHRAYVPERGCGNAN